MSKSNLQATVSPRGISDFAYPDGTHFLVLQSDQGEAHLIFGTDASPVANYANAPNGSVYVCIHTTAGNNKIWVKFPDAGQGFGSKTGTWRATAQLA